MPLEIAEKDYLEPQIIYVRAGLLVLALVALLETERGKTRDECVLFVGAYLLVALIAAGVCLWRGHPAFRISILFDLIGPAFFLVVSASLAATWCMLLIPVFALAARGRTRTAYFVSAAAVLVIAGGAALREDFDWKNLVHGVAPGASTLALAAMAGFLGGREREHVLRRRFLEKIIRRLHFDRGLSESIRQAGGELALAFECEQACVAICDDELERLFVWRVRPSDREPLAPETHALSRSDTFLTDCLEVTLCWNSLEGKGEGFGWDRRTGERFKNLPKPPSSTSAEFGARALMAATVEAAGRPAGRIILLNPRRRLTPADLRWFEEIVRQVEVPLENVFLLRHVRARAVEAERSRISRDLHDGILQTLLSLQIQLDVLRRKLPQSPDQVAGDLATLQQTVKQEGEELRRMVTDLRPLRVESADLHELMYGFAERFQNESSVVVDLFIENGDLRVPDRVCREIFQIYRESLNNIKKHAHASHVVVKLGQDEARVSLVVDDNGLGFSFSGRYASEELDRLRLGPISIKERTRGVGGTLTVESNPGHGARLTIEIPLS
ncbi:MAG: sensor histidine kinase [Candidatus Acidiferrales bacterium]